VATQLDLVDRGNSRKHRNSAALGPGTARPRPRTLVPGRARHVEIPSKCVPLDVRVVCCMLMTMKANPGGQIDSKTAVGRDQLIKLLWEAVDQQSLIITAERRIGKTTVIKKMRDEPAAGWFPVYQDLEGCDSAEEFAMAVYKEIHQFLSKMGRPPAERRSYSWHLEGWR